MNTKLYNVIFAIIVLLNGNIFAQQFSASTSYGWDQWQTNQWGYIYQDGWCYAVAGESYEYLHYGFLSESYRRSIRPVANARDFYFRFEYRDLNLHELTKKEWREIKKSGGWIEKYCEFEYYISDQYPTLKSALSAYSWPCAKKYVDPRKPVVLKKEKVRTKIYLTDDDEVRALNSFFDECSFAIAVHGDYSGYTMTYSY